MRFQGNGYGSDESGPGIDDTINFRHTTQELTEEIISKGDISLVVRALLTDSTGFPGLAVCGLFCRNGDLALGVGESFETLTASGLGAINTFDKTSLELLYQIEGLCNRSEFVPVGWIYSSANK